MDITIVQYRRENPTTHKRCRVTRVLREEGLVFPVRPQDPLSPSVRTRLDELNTAEGCALCPGRCRLEGVAVNPRLDVAYAHLEKTLGQMPTSEKEAYLKSLLLGDAASEPLQRIAEALGAGGYLKATVEGIRELWERSAYAV